jgi:hypothetical protein
VVKVVPFVSFREQDVPDALGLVMLFFMMQMKYHSFSLLRLIFFFSVEAEECRGDSFFLPAFSVVVVVV